MSESFAYKLYTDGSGDATETGEGNGGAWAYVLLHGLQFQQPVERWTIIEDLAKFMPRATNNQGELSGVIHGLTKALQAIPVPSGSTKSQIEIISDSAYVINCFKQKWYVKWKKNGWYSSSGPVKNKDLWEEVLKRVEVLERVADIKWTHVRGHQGNHWNEHVDRMCTKVRKDGIAARESGVHISDLNNLYYTTGTD